MTARVFIHLRDDLPDGFHRTIGGDVIESSRIVEPKCYMLSTENGCFDPAEARNLGLTDNGMLGVIGSKSLQNDQFILFSHRPGERYRGLDQSMFGHAVKRMQLETSGMLVLVYDQYFRLVDSSAQELYFT
jgi:hypothetical protein